MSLYVLQFFATPLLLSHSFLGVLLSNALYALSLSYYHYLQFLGYSALPFLERTELFLYPIAGVALVVPFSILARFNPTAFVLQLYFGQNAT